MAQMWCRVAMPPPEFRIPDCAISLYHKRVAARRDGQAAPRRMAPPVQRVTAYTSPPMGCRSKGDDDSCASLNFYGLEFGHVDLAEVQLDGDAVLQFVKRGLSQVGGVHND